MSALPERRGFGRRASGSVTCRVCYAWVQVLPERVEETDLYTYYRCQRCEGSFPIRRTDVDGAPSPDGE